MIWENDTFLRRAKRTKETIWPRFKNEANGIQQKRFDKVANINKKISISIKFPDGMRIAKTGISFTELKHLIERW